MKVSPILMAEDMVVATLDGVKDRTRRIVKLPHSNPLGSWEPTTVGGQGVTDFASNSVPERVAIWHTRTGDCLACPHGETGDLLWVRETFYPVYPQDPNYNNGLPIEYDYRATYKNGDRLGDYWGPKKWTPSIYMPRRASRLTLEITEVRVERLQDITDDDAKREGVSKTPWWEFDPCTAFMYLWDALNLERGYGWETNPWVWVLAYKAHKMNIDQFLKQREAA